ncbi:MAG: hypothetical protein HWN80_00580 [Candidatus Lokiarchaeota archaeon]|nr:hypothetical protein [Candidatus Lokiarchaeota archaeon]
MRGCIPLEHVQNKLRIQFDQIFLRVRIITLIIIVLCLYLYLLFNYLRNKTLIEQLVIITADLVFSIVLGLLITWVINWLTDNNYIMRDLSYAIVGELVNVGIMLCVSFKFNR